MRRWTRRLATSVAGTVAALALAEASLQVWAFVQAKVSARDGASPAGADGRPVVLFVGDSNVYGLWVEPEEALPGRAESLSRECCPPGIRAVNRGWPSAPTWVARQEAVRSIAELAPAAVVVRAGLNNRLWAAPDEERWLDRLRLVRMARVLARQAEDERIEEGRADGELIRTAGRGGVEGAHRLRRPETPHTQWEPLAPVAQRDLAAIAGAASAAGARTYFATYFDDHEGFEGPNRELAEAARATGSALVDLAAVGREALARFPRGDLLYYDHHPTPLGYELEARELVAALVRDGILSGRPPEPPLAVLDRATPSAPAAVTLLESGEQGARFAVRARPGSRGWLVIGRCGGPMLFKGSEPLPIESTEECRPFLTAFPVDASGAAEVETPALASRYGPRPCAAVVIAIDSKPNYPPRFYSSPAIELAPGPAR